jgi:hypothetical protein
LKIAVIGRDAPDVERRVLIIETPILTLSKSPDTDWIRELESENKKQNLKLAAQVNEIQSRDATISQLRSQRDECQQRLDTIKNRYGDLHFLVDLDAQDLSSRIEVISWCLRDFEENLKKYRLLFSFQIKNNSVINIRISEDPTGHIEFDNIALLDTAHLSESNVWATPHNAENGHFTIEQRLKEGEAAIIRDARNIALVAGASGHLKFSFAHLELLIEAPKITSESVRLGVLTFDARTGAGIASSGRAWGAPLE